MKEMPISPGRFEAELKARKGTPAQADVERLYAMRAAFVLALQVKGIVDVRDIGELDRLGRCEVASHHWRLCTPEARDALLRDAHHQVRSCASISQLNEKDTFLLSRVDHDSEALLELLDHSGSMQSVPVQRAAASLRRSIALAAGDHERAQYAQETMDELGAESHLDAPRG